MKSKTKHKEKKEKRKKKEKNFEKCYQKTLKDKPNLTTTKQYRTQTKNPRIKETKRSVMTDGGTVPKNIKT